MVCFRKASVFGLWVSLFSASTVYADQGTETTDKANGHPEAQVRPHLGLDMHTRAIALLLERKSSDALDWLDKRAVSDPMSAAELAQYWRLRGLAWGRLGQGNEAQNAFSIALRIDPSFRLRAFRDEDVPGADPQNAEATSVGKRLFAEAAGDAEIRSPFQAALAALPAPANALTARYQLQSEKIGVRFHVTEIADDLDLVSRVKIQGKSEAWEEDPDGTVAPMVLAEGEGPWSIRLLDKNGHELWARKLDTSRNSVVASAPRDFRDLAVAGGVTMATGALLTLGANTVSAFVPSESSKVGEQGWFLGAMWTGAGLVAIGAGMVIYDLIASESTD